MTQACESQERVLKDPAPNAFLSQFGADGLEFTVSYWIADPENGQLAQFTGTTQYYRILPTFVVTDGVKYLMDHAECYWLAMLPSEY